jgi:uncharacterized protein
MDRTVGIVGIANSGKTVFLTSLINHLSHHDPEKMRLTPLKRTLILRKLLPECEEVEITKFESIPVSGSIPEFPYERFRHALTQETPIWPEKTSAASMYDCSFERSDWLHPIRLRLLDFPGERLADVTMAGDFAKWSDIMLDQIENDQLCRNHAGEYLDLINQQTLDEHLLIKSYRLTLAKFVNDFKPLISPSTFLLDQNGQQAHASSIEEMAETRYSGLSENRQFAPLSRQARNHCPELTKEFAMRYKEYRSVVIDPMMKALKACDRLVVLIDVQQILSSGVGAYNDNQLILKKLLGLFPRDRSLLKPILTIYLRLYLLLPWAWRPGGVSRIAFVAPKADIVGPDQTDELQNLLREFVHDEAKNYDIHKEYFTCAAVSSTKSDDGKLLGHPNYDSEGNWLPAPAKDESLQLVRSTPIPEEWPERWGPNEYFYPAVYPLVSPRRDAPPNQESLGTILDYLLEEKFME